MSEAISEATTEVAVEATAQPFEVVAEAFPRARFVPPPTVSRGCGVDLSRVLLTLAAFFLLVPFDGLTFFHAPHFRGVREAPASASAGAAAPPFRASPPPAAA